MCMYVHVCVYVCVYVRRYTLFFVLYPTGAGSEFLLGYAALAHAPNEYRYVLMGVLALYFPRTSRRHTHMRTHRHLLTCSPVGALSVWTLGTVFPWLYTHMITQRGKQLGGGSGKVKKTA
jgi:very-long-chain (3R)-3-hydroxyacyl-CoA dehydratase